MNTRTIAWQWTTHPVLNDAVHGLGAFLTSPGLAGLGALVAAWQVWRNRQAEDDRHHADLEHKTNQLLDDREHHRNEVAQWAKDAAATAAEATANRNLDQQRHTQEQLWQRFQWLEGHTGSLGFDASIQALLSIADNANEAHDAHLEQIADMLVESLTSEVLRLSEQP